MTEGIAVEEPDSQEDVGRPSFLNRKLNSPKFGSIIQSHIRAMDTMDTT